MRLVLRNNRLVDCRSRALVCSNLFINRRSTSGASNARSTWCTIQITVSLSLRNIVGILGVECSLKVICQILSTLVNGAIYQSSWILVWLMGKLMMICIFVHNKRRVLALLWIILSLFKFIETFINLNVSNCMSMALLCLLSCYRCWISCASTSGRSRSATSWYCCVSSSLSKSFKHIICTHWLNICTCVRTSCIVLWEISMRSLVRSLCLYT